MPPCSLGLGTLSTSEKQKETTSVSAPEYVELENVAAETLGGMVLHDEVADDFSDCVGILDPQEKSKCLEESRRRHNLDWTVLEGKLYGREEEAMELSGAFARQVCKDYNHDNSSREIVLISGTSGAGKTALARTLRKPVLERGGFFVSGKFDQLHCPVGEPYAPFVSAFTEFTSLVVSHGPEMVEAVKRDVKTAMDPEIPLITDVIPALKQILLSEKEEEELSSGGRVVGSEAQKRLHSVFCKFVQSICSTNRPLVLFLDDLQWADEGSLDLLQTLASEKDNNHGLVLVGACRNDEIALDHPLAVMLRRMEDQARVVITHIKVPNLTKGAIHDLVSGLLHKRKCQRSKSLANIIHTQTEGNIFFALDYIKSLHEEGVLYCTGNDVGHGWRWEEDRINALATDNDGVMAVASKLTRLPEAVQDVLKVASCIGAEFDEYLLNDLLPPTQVSMALVVATEKGFVLNDEENNTSGGGGGNSLSGGAGLRFAHNNIQQAAYSLIPESERDAFHLCIGRRLWDELPPEDIEMNIFVVGNQLKRGVNLLQEDDERCRMAVLFLRAAEKAMSSSDFLTAVRYLELGIDLLRKQRYWRDQYDLSLTLYNSAAEAQYCTGNFERMDSLIDEVLKNARTFHDKIRAYTTKVYALGSRQQLREAIETGVEVLDCLGETLPSKHNTLSMAADFMKTRHLLRGKSDEDLLNLPIMVNSDTTACMQILNLLFTYTFLYRSDFAPHLTFRMIRLTLRRGLNAIAALGFSSYGLFLCGTGDVDTGYRYGQLALVVLDKFNARQCLSKVFCLVYGMINVWKNPLRLSMDPLKHAHQVGLQTGDVQYSMVSVHLRCLTAYVSGRPLDKLEKELRAAGEQMSAYKQSLWLALVNPLLQHVLNFMGEAEDPLVLSGEALDQEAALTQARENQHNAVVCTIHIWRLILTYYFHDYKLAWAMSIAARKVRRSEKVTRSAFLVRLHYFYHGLTALALARVSPKRGLIANALKMLKQIKKYAKHSPANFLNKVKLMEAELAAVRGNFDVSLRKYEESIALASEEGLMHEQALACERAGLTLRDFDHQGLALQYLRKARSLYQEWGALAKVAQMDTLIPEAMEEAPR